jgi:hypothetical protein
MAGEIYLLLSSSDVNGRSFVVCRVFEQNVAIGRNFAVARVKREYISIIYIIDT